jgi:hypothetical protein
METQHFAVKQNGLSQFSVIVSRHSDARLFSGTFVSVHEKKSALQLRRTHQRE